MFYVFKGDGQGGGGGEHVKHTQTGVFYRFKGWRGAGIPADVLRRVGMLLGWGCGRVVVSSSTCRDVVGLSKVVVVSLLWFSTCREWGC
jgi:hypothetical protein